METLDVKLTMAEVNAILQMIDKTQTIGVQTMRVLLALDAKLRQAAQKTEAPNGPTD